MEKMGGLGKKMTITNWVFLVGVLAMSGIPPFAAFFSKDMILEQEYMAGFEVLFYLSLGASILTGVYLIRAYCITFLGETRVEKGTFYKLHDVEKVMIYPVIILAIFSFGGGWLGFSFEGVPLLASFLKEIGLKPIEKELSTEFILSYETLLTIGGALLGVILSMIVYTRYYQKLGPTVQFLKRSFYLDEIYDRLFVYPLKALSKCIDYFIEPVIFEGSIKAVEKGTQGIARGLQQVQSGQIRSYIGWMVIGMVFLTGMFIYYIQ